MGEHTNNPNRPLTREELKNKLSELYVQYQKLVGEYQNALMKLEQMNFDSLAFTLQMMFKVMDNAEMYSPEFVKWVKENIEASLTSFVTSLEAKKEEAKKEQEKTKNEAE